MDSLQEAELRLACLRLAAEVCLASHTQFSVKQYAQEYWDFVRGPQPDMTAKGVAATIIDTSDSDDLPF